MAAISWTFGILGDWATKADWSTDSIPGSADDVTINASGTYTVTVLEAESAHSLILNAAGATLSVTNALTIGTTLAADAGTLSLGSGGSLNGGTVVASGATIVFAGGTLNGVTWQGPLTMSGSAETATMTGAISLTGVGGSGAGSLSVTGTSDVLTVLGTVIDTGVLTISAGSFVVQDGGQATIAAAGNNSGTFGIANNSSVTVNGNFTNSAALNVDSYYTPYDGTTTQGGSSLTITGTLSNNGTAAAVQVGDTSLQINGPTSITLGGLVNGAGESFQVEGSSGHLATLAFSNGGTGFASNGGNFQLNYAAPLALNTSFNNSGTFGIANNSSVTVNGNFTNSAALNVDSYYTPYDGTTTQGGSSLTITGTLSNNGTAAAVQVGDTSLQINGPTSITLGGLVNGAGESFQVEGSSGHLATLAFSNGGTGFASNGGNFQLNYAAPLALNTSFNNSGTFGIANNSSVTVNGNFTNSAALNVDSYYTPYDGTTTQGGSSLTITGTLSNNGTAAAVQVGDTSLQINGPTSITLGGLVNGAGESFQVEGSSGHLATLAFSNGGTGFASNGGNFQLNYAAPLALNTSFNNSGTFGIANNSSVTVNGNFTNSAALNVDSYYTPYDGTTTQGGSSLTITGTLSNNGTAAAVQVGDTSLQINGPTSITLGGLVNGAGESFQVEGSSGHLATLAFSNGGTGFASNGGNFQLNYAAPLALNTSFNNSGTFGIANNSSVTVNGNFTNSAALNVDSYYTPYDGTTTQGGSSLTITGTLSNNGTAAAVQVGDTSLQINGPTSITLGGLVNGAGESFQVEGSSGHLATLAFSNGGTGFASNGGNFQLNYAAPLALNTSFNNSGTFGIANNSSVTVNGNFTNSAALNVDSYYTPYDGTTTQGGSSLTITGTLSNNGTAAAVQVGDTSLQINGPTSITLGGLANTGSLSLYGNSATVMAVMTVTGSESNSGIINIGSYSALQVTGSDAFKQTAGTTTVNGTITAASIDIFGGLLLIDTTSFTNQTTLWASTGGTIDASGGGLTNLSAGVLTGGVYEIDANSALKFASAASLTTDNADIILKGTAAVIESGTTSINAELTSIGTAGILDLVSGGSFNSATGFVDNGQIQLNAGTFAAGGIGITGTIVGAGTVAAIVVNSGVVDATGGRLDITKGASGAGLFTIAAASALEFDSTVASGTDVTFGGTGATLRIGSLGTSTTAFAGTLVAFAAGETIDLLNTTATSATIVGSAINITLQGGGTLSYATSSSLVGLNLATVTDGAGGTDIVAYRIAQASPVAPNPVTFANHHVGDTVTQALSITNIAAADGYSEALDGSVSASSPITATGSFTGLGAGQTNSSSLVVGVNTSSSGVKSGTATVNLSSDGTGIDGHGTTPLLPQSVTVTGTVYAYASPTVTAAVNFGAVRTTSAAPTQSVLIANGSTANAYQEGLRYALQAPSSGFSITSGGTTGTVASGGTNAETLAMSVTTAGTISGTDVVTLTSTGVGTSGLADTGLGTATVALTGTVFATAIPEVSATSLNFGAVHQDASISQAITITNGNSGALTDSLLGGFGTVTGGYNGSGSLGGGLGSGQSSTLTVTMNTGTVGVDTGSAALALSSHDTVLSDVGVSAGPVTLTGTVYAYAAPILPTTTLNFGAARVGGSALTQTLAIDDGAIAKAYQESLIYSIAASAPFSVPSGGTGTIVSGGSAAPTVTLATGTSGNFSGSTLTVGLTSTGQGTSGLGNTPLAAETVALDGKIYATATAEPSTTTLNFGVVHTNTLATESLTIANAATGALVDTLLLTAANASGAFGSDGSVVAGGTITQTFTMESGTSGTVSSTGTLDFASYDSDLGSLALNAGTIALVGTIDNYATAQWEKVSGSGSFTTAGTLATLNFGTVVLDGTAPTVDLGALNAATGLADLMFGSFEATGTTGFTDAGFGSFSALAAGQADTSPTITLSTSQPGVFTEMVTLSAYGTNTSGYYGALNSDTLVVTGTVQAAGAGVSITGPTANQPITDQQTIAPFSGVTISDSNVGQSETLTVTLSAAGDGSLNSVGGGTYSAGAWSMIGSLAAINTALDELIFTPMQHQVAPGQTVTTTFSIKDTDTAGSSASNSTTSVIVTAGTLLPTITGTNGDQTTTGTVAISPFSGVTIDDLNVGQTETVTVTMSNAADGTLTATAGGSYNASSGTFIDTGTVAAVTAALDGLIFTPAGTQAAGQTVTTTFTIQDTDTAGAGASDSTTSVVDTASTGSPFYLTPIYTNGTVELQVWATAGDYAEAADLSITVSPTAGVFGSISGPSNWLVEPNPETGKVLLSEAGTSPIGTTTAGLLATIDFTPAAGATSLSATATVTDWTDANNVEHGSFTMGPTIVPLDALMSGVAYSWDNHAVLSGVTVSALGSGDPAGAGQSPIDLQNVHIDANGNLVAEVWANAGTGAENFDATFATASGITANFQQASTLPSNWSVAQNNTTSDILNLAGAGLTDLTGEVQLGTITWTLPSGTTQADVSLTSGDIGSTTASPLSLAYGVSISATNGSYSVTVLPGDTYDVNASLAAGNVGNAITSADALAALKLAVGLNPNPTINGTQLPVSPYQYIAADVTDNGVVNSADALAILKMAVDLPGSETPTWEFLNENETFWDPTTGTFTVNSSNVPTSFVNTDSLSSSGTMDLVGVLTGDVNGSWVPVDSGGNPISNYATIATSYFEAQSAALGNVPLALWGLPTPSSPVTVTASSGNDTLYASPGATLICDSNTDVLSFLAPADSPVGNPATISGFNPFLGDQIDLSSIDANDLLPGIQAFTFIGTSAFSGTPGELRYYNSDGETIIQGSTAGTGASFQIDLTGSLALQSADFKL